MQKYMLSRGLTFDEYIERGAIPEPNSGCLLWLGPTGRTGYGYASWKGRQTLAHRIVWQMRRGPIPAGKVVCHKCDVRGCVNVDHMFVGTYRDNSIDMVKKGRGKPASLKGITNHKARLTEDQVRAIRLDARISRLVSETYGVSMTAIDHIRKGRSWRHIQ